MSPQPLQPRLDDHGQPLPLFGFLNAHDAFRRDLPRFAEAARRIAVGELDADGLDALRHHWSVYRTFLEQHHAFEDAHLFPITAREPELKVLVDELSEQHQELHDLLPRITDLLAAVRPTVGDGGPELGTAMATAAALLVPHFAAEEEHLVPVLRAAMAAQPSPPPPPDDAEEPVVPDSYGVPFTTEHLSDEVRAAVLPLFPSRPDPAAVEGWLVAYRAGLARWVR